MPPVFTKQQGRCIAHHGICNHSSSHAIVISSLHGDPKGMEHANLLYATMYVQNIHAWNSASRKGVMFLFELRFY